MSDWPKHAQFLPLTAGGVVGRAFSKRMSSHAVDVLFQILLIVITGISCYNLYSYATMM